MISLQGKTNFFEKPVAEYQKAGVLKKEDEADTPKFSLEDGVRDYLNFIINFERKN